MLRTLLIIFVMFFPSLAYAEKFFSLRSDEVYMRYGPSTDHPIKWVYKQKGWPMKVLNEFDQWVKLRDISGEEGWIHRSLLSTRKYAIVQANDERGYAVLKKKKDMKEGVIRIEEGMLLRIHDCENTVCKASTSSFKGYIEKKSLWGIVQSQ